MGFLDFLFGKSLVPSELKPEVDRMVQDLIRIGQTEDFLSERPGGSFNAQSRHIRAREIGKRLNEIGGFELMEKIYKRVRKQLGAQVATHLSYAWAEIGKWVP
ncbi:MAG: hypothetical protein ACYC6H_06935 [Bellilinea sp.]